MCLQFFPTKILLKYFHLILSFLAFIVLSKYVKNKCVHFIHICTIYEKKKALATCQYSIYRAVNKNNMSTTYKISVICGTNKIWQLIQPKFHRNRMADR